MLLLRLLLIISTIDTALNSVNVQRAKLGVAQSKLENVLSYAQAQNEAYSTAVSSILDVDYAEETANMTRFQIMQQVGVAALGQARSIPQSILFHCWDNLTSSLSIYSNMQKKKGRHMSSFFFFLSLDAVDEKISYYQIKGGTMGLRADELFWD